MDRRHFEVTVYPCAVRLHPLESTPRIGALRYEPHIREYLLPDTPKADATSLGRAELRRVPDANGVDTLHTP